MIRSGSYIVGDQTPSQAIRLLNTQLIQKAATAIEGQTVQERNLRTLTLAISQNSIPEFDRLFDEFQRKVRNLAEKESKKTDVYAWTMQFYRLNERKEK